VDKLDKLHHLLRTFQAYKPYIQFEFHLLVDLLHKEYIHTLLIEAHEFLEDNLDNFHVL